MLVSFCTFQNQVSPMSLIIGKHIHKRGVCVCVHIDIDTQTNKQSKGFQVSCCCSLTKLCPTLCYHMNCSTRLPCPLLSPRVCSDSCLLSQWCYLIISSSATPFSICLQSLPALGASLVAQTVKLLPAMCETRDRFLGWEDLLEKEMAIHSSTLAWKSPWTEEPDRLQSTGSQRVRHDWATSLQGLFHRVGPSVRWPKYWSFGFSINPSNEYSGLISFL